jgi:hypothetical protein
VLVFLLVLLPLVGINYLVFSTLSVLLNRTYTFLMLHHAETIFKLHETFCCATTTAMQRLASGRDHGSYNRGCK